MKLVLFNGGQPGVLKDDGVVEIGHIVSNIGASIGQEAMEAIITNYDDIRSDLLNAEKTGALIPLAEVQLEAPLPRPNKILCMGGNFTEFLSLIHI